MQIFVQRDRDLRRHTDLSPRIRALKTSPVLSPSSLWTLRVGSSAMSCPAGTGDTTTSSSSRHSVLPSLAVRERLCITICSRVRVCRCVQWGQDAFGRMDSGAISNSLSSRYSSFSCSLASPRLQPSSLGSFRAGPQLVGDFSFDLIVFRRSNSLRACYVSCGAVLGSCRTSACRAVCKSCAILCMSYAESLLASASLFRNLKRRLALSRLDLVSGFIRYVHILRLE